VWAGLHRTALRFSVAAGESARQQLGLCLLAPGLFQIGLQHWSCRPVLAGPAAAAVAAAAQQQQQGRKKGLPQAPLFNTMVAAHPCFVLSQPTAKPA